MAHYTLDRASTTLTVDQIGRTQSVTPEGFLLCEGVRIARTGPMLYRHDEVPEIEPGSNGAMVTMLRGSDVLFAADTIASFVGKPVTNDHPDDLVIPDTWRDLACGTVLNVRPGEGLEAEYLLADLLITDADCIADVRDGKREVSCGYETEAETVKPGLGRVTRMIGNHVALVDRGRCGPACAIQDGDPNMAKAKKRTVWDRLVTAFHAKDEAAFTEELEAAKEEAEGSDDDKNIHVHVNLNGAEAKGETEAEEKPAKDAEADPAEERFAKIEAAVAAIAETVGKLVKAEKSEAESHEDLVTDEGEEKAEGEEVEEKKPVMDAAAFSAEFTETLSRAEILAPGITLPKFDAKANRKVMADAMCGLRRKALAKAFDSAETKPFVVTIAGPTPNFKTMTCDHAAAVFRGASELAKAARSSVKDGVSTLETKAGRMTPEKLQNLIIERRKSAR